MSSISYSPLQMCRSFGEGSGVRRGGAGGSPQIWGKPLACTPKGRYGGEVIRFPKSNPSFSPTSMPHSPKTSLHPPDMGAIPFVPIRFFNE